MSVTVTYKCDKCGKEQYSPQQFWEARIGHRHLASTNWCESKSIQVCRKCLENFGLVPKIETKEDNVPLPTIEELIREILVRCGVENVA